MKDNIKTNFCLKDNVKSKAFTLAEMMVVMLVLSIVLAASMPLITKKSSLNTSSIWKYVPTDKTHVYYGLSASNSAMIGTKAIPSDTAAKNSMLYINSPGAATTYPQIAFGVNGTPYGRMYMGSNLVAIGPSNTTATGNNSTAIGQSNTASGASSVAVGQLNEAKASNTTALGIVAKSNGGTSTAVGYYATASASSSTAVGQYVTASAGNAIALGRNSTASGSNSSALGFQSKASNTNATAIGDTATASGSNSTAVGNNCTAGGTSSQAIGHAAGTTGNYSIASGYSAAATGNYSIALGPNTVAGSAHDITIGFQPKTIANSGGYNIAIGYNASVVETNAQHAIAIGSNSKVQCKNSIAIGDTAQAYGYGSGYGCAIAIGDTAYSWSSYTTAVGQNSKATAHCASAYGVQAQASGIAATAIGHAAKATADYATAIGYGAEAAYKSSAAIGQGAKATAVGQIRIGDNQNVYIKGKLYLGCSDGSTVYVYKNGSNYLTTSSGQWLSDRRVKKILGEYVSSLAQIKKLKVYNYQFKEKEMAEKYRKELIADKDNPMCAGKTNDEYKKCIDKAVENYRKNAIKNHEFSKGRVGIIAQDLEKVFPGSVITDKSGYKEIDTNEIFYAMVNAIKELDQKIENVINTDISAIYKRMDEISALAANNDTINVLQKRMDNLENVIKSDIESIKNEANTFRRALIELKKDSVNKKEFTAWVDKFKELAIRVASIARQVDQNTRNIEITKTFVYKLKSNQQKDIKNVRKFVTSNSRRIDELERENKELRKRIENLEKKIK